MSNLKLPSDVDKVSKGATPATYLISLTAFAVVWPNLITAQIPGCLDVTSLLVLPSFFSSPSYFGIGC
jgi:hypothetical protein